MHPVTQLPDVQSIIQRVQELQKRDGVFPASFEEITDLDNRISAAIKKNPALFAANALERFKAIIKEMHERCSTPPLEDEAPPSSPQLEDSETLEMDIKSTPAQVVKSFDRPIIPSTAVMIHPAKAISEPKIGTHSPALMQKSYSQKVESSTTSAFNKNCKK